MTETDFRARPDTGSHWWVWLIGVVLFAMIIWWIVVWAAAPGQQTAAAPVRRARVAASAPAYGTAPAAPGASVGAAPGTASGTAAAPRERVAGSRQQMTATGSASPARP